MGGLEGQMGCEGEHCMRVGSQQPMGGFEGLPVIEALVEGQMGWVERHCVFVGSQHSCGRGGCDERTVIDTDGDGAADNEGFPEMEADMDGREDGAEEGDAEGQINVPAGQFDSVGSQQAPVPLLLPYRAVDEGDTEGQMTEDDEHCILVGSQHPSEGGIGDALNSRKIIVAEGDGVIIPASTSEHSASPGVHDPFDGSQHRTPLILVSPEFEVCAAPVAIAARKRRCRNMFALLMYDFFLEILNILNFL